MVEAERRETVQRYHQLKDAAEQFDGARAACADPQERERLERDFALFRQQHREEDVRRGKGVRGGHITMHQIMWTRWIQVTDRHEASARSAYEQLLCGDSQALADEMLDSLVAITAAAMTIEALYEDIRYLIPERSGYAYADERVADGISVAFGFDGMRAGELRTDLRWLFGLRNEAAHGYAEPELPKSHPAGFTTSAVASRFNAVQSRRALEVCVEVLDGVASSRAPANRWVARWIGERQAYQRDVVAPIRARLMQAP